jgi:hypothetical protein
MTFCNCSLPALNGNNECCKNCNNNNVEYIDMGWNPFPWIKDGKLIKVVKKDEKSSNK